MRKQDILDYMESSIENAESCLKILETLGADTRDNRKIVDKMIKVYTKFQAICQVENFAAQLDISSDELVALMEKLE